MCMWSALWYPNVTPAVAGGSALPFLGFPCVKPGRVSEGKGPNTFCKCCGWVSTKPRNHFQGLAVQVVWCWGSVDRPKAARILCPGSTLCRLFFCAIGPNPQFAGSAACRYCLLLSDPRTEIGHRACLLSHPCPGTPPGSVRQRGVEPCSPILCRALAKGPGSWLSLAHLRQAPAGSNASSTDAGHTS